MLDRVFMPGESRLAKVIVDRDVTMVGGVFLGGVAARGLRVGGGLSLDGTVVNGPILAVADGSIHDNFSFSEAKIQTEAGVYAERLRVAGSFFMDGTRLEGSKSGELNMGAAVIEGDVVMRDSTSWSPPTVCCGGACASAVS